MFIPCKTEGGKNPAVLMLPASAITPKVGMALYMSDGKLAVASGTHVAQYISMTEAGAALTAGTLIPVIRVLPDILFETGKDGENTMTPGAAYDVASGGLLVDDDGTDTGNFLCEQIDGSRVFGRFVKLTDDPAPAPAQTV